MNQVRGRTQSEFHMECECGEAIVSHNKVGRCAYCGTLWEVRHPTVLLTDREQAEKSRKQKVMKEIYKKCL